MGFEPISKASRVNDLNVSVAQIADQMLSVRENRSLKVLLDRFDNNSTAGNFTALLRAVEKTMKSSGFQRTASADLINQLGGDFTNVATTLGVSGNTSNIGAAVAVRAAYNNLSQREGGSIFGGILGPLVLPGKPAAPDDSVLKTFDRLGVSPDALIAIFNSTTNPDAARRFASQMLLHNLLKSLIPENQLPTDDTKAFSMDGVTEQKYHLVRSNFVNLVQANGQQLQSPHLYPVDEGLNVNSELLTAAKQEIDRQTASGKLDSTKSQDLVNILKIIKAINGVPSAPQDPRQGWKELYLAQVRAQTKAATLAVLLICLTPLLLVQNSAVAQTDNLFDPKPLVVANSVRTDYQPSSLTAKFQRSASAEKFNAAPNEKITYVGDDPTAHMLPADQTPAVRVNKEAPGPFIAMKKAYDEGDLETAHAFADQYVRYMQRVMFEVRELSQMVGEALVRNGVVDEEDWVGASQFMGREMARDQSTQKVAFRATADVALERIQADTKHQAEVYVFCSVTSTYCREMGPEIERIYRLTKNDSAVKFGVFVIGTGQEQYLKDFKSYTGMSMPIQDGSELAKQFRVSFVPAVVVRAPTTNRAYLRTGLISFPRFYEFIKTVQGLPVTMSDREMNIVSVPIGFAERNPEEFRGNESDAPGVIAASTSLEPASGKLQRF